MKPELDVKKYAPHAKKVKQKTGLSAVAILTLNQIYLWVDKK